MADTALSKETCRNYLSEMKAHEMIVQGADKRWRKNSDVG